MDESFSVDSHAQESKDRDLLSFAQPLGQNRLPGPNIAGLYNLCPKNKVNFYKMNSYKITLLQNIITKQ